MRDSHFGIIVVAALAALGAIAYVNTFDGEWVWDDASSVLRHKHVQDPSQFLQLFREDQHAFGRGQGNFYRPLVSASLMIDFALSYDPDRDRRAGAAHPDVKPLVFHVTNLLWHVAAALLFFALLARIKAPRFVQAAAPLLYVLHPAHTEAVAYISGRADMMSAAFMFAGLYFALGTGSPVRRILGWSLSSLCFTAGLLCKESALIFPFLLLLFVLIRPPSGEEGIQRGRVYLFRAAPLVLAFAIMGAYGALRMTVLRFAEAGGPAAAPLGQRLVETCQAFAFYVRVLFLPTGLHMEQTLDGTPGWTALAGALLLVLCVAIFVLGLRSRQHRIALGMGWFLVAWFPISGVFPLNAPMAEHWLYVPMAGFWWAAAEVAKQGQSLLEDSRGQSPFCSLARRAAVAAVYALCVLFVALTVARNRDWHSNEALFRATLRENPATTRVHYNLAVTYEDLTGNLAGARRHYEAILRLEEAKKGARSIDSGLDSLLDTEVDVHLSLGRVFLAQGKYTHGMQHFGVLANRLKQEKHRPEAAAAAMGMGACLLATGNMTMADAYLRQAIALNPANRARVFALLQGAPI